MIAEEKFIIVPKERPAVVFACNLLVIPKDDFDEYVKEIDRHHVEFVRSLEKSWDVTADVRATEAVKMAKEHYEKIIAEKDKVIAELETNLSEIQSQKMQLEDDVALLRHNNAELKEERRWRSVSEELPKLKEDSV